MVKAEAFSEGTVCAKREGKVGLGMGMKWDEQ
jgi:hypothetical protein